jgi:hypothetical protein
MWTSRVDDGGRKEPRVTEQLTASAVEGKKIIVSTAILFMAELSLPVSCDIRCCIRLYS